MHMLILEHARDGFLCAYDARAIVLYEKCTVCSGFCALVLHS